MAQRRRLCIFCNGKNISGEHVWPDWIGQYVSASQGAKYGEYGYSFRHTGEMAGLVRERYYNGPSSTKKLRVVCETCNNQWMSRIETGAKPFLGPMMFGSGLALSNENRLMLARWVALKTMVIEHGDHAGLVTPYDMRDEFRRTGNMPQNFHIWIARHHVHEWQFQMRRHTAVVAKPGAPLPPMDQRNMQVVALGVGQLFILAVTVTAPGVEIPLRVPPWMPKLWPALGELHWPPAQAFDWYMLERMANITEEMFHLPGVAWQDHV